MILSIKPLIINYGKCQSGGFFSFITLSMRISIGFLNFSDSMSHSTDMKTSELLDILSFKKFDQYDYNVKK